MNDLLKNYKYHDILAGILKIKKVSFIALFFEKIN